MKVDVFKLMTGTGRQALRMLHHAIVSAERRDHLPVYRSFVTSLSGRRSSRR